MKTYLTIIAWLIAITSYSQTAIKKSSIDSGGAITNNGSLSMVYTLGEAAVQESTTAIIQISEGFLGANISTSALGLEDYSQLRGISVYPNPATHNITISMQTSASYFLLRVNGQVISEGKLNVGENTLNISKLSKGIYFLRIKTKEGVSSEKIIKE